MAQLHFSLLGEFICRSVEGQAVVFPTRKVRALAAYLAASAGQQHGRDKLAGLLWEDTPDAQARANLRKTLSRLQQSIPVTARWSLAVDMRTVALIPAAITVDQALFERLVADGTPETLEQAFALYRGPFLEGLEGCGEAFEDWLTAERRRLDETLQQALHRLLEHYAATGAIDPAIRLALRLLAIDPLDEGVYRMLIRLYLYQDRIGAALEQYRRCRERLAEELGIDPAPETERLRAEILGLLPKNASSEDAWPRERDDPPERARVIETAAAARARRRTAPAARPSIAVLAFVPVEDAVIARRHLGDGMAEDIATELGRFRELDVIAPATTLAYRTAAAAPERIGAELGVDYILDGRLRCLGERLRITARLLETAGARQVWAERYDCALAGVFDVQDDMVCRIVGSLAGRIEDDRLEQARCKRPQDWQAYELWLRGWSALKRTDLPAIHEARRCFQQAVTRDPHYARAYVGLALAHLNEWACYAWNHWVFLQKEALDLARKAVALDDRDHRAHCMLGLAELYGQRYEAARRELLRALELNPNDADVLAHASFALALIGEQALGVDAARKALRIAPHRPEWYAGMAGIAFFSARLYEEAIDTMASAPQAFCNTPAFIAASYAHLGRTEQGASHRETVYRHYRYQLARGAFPADIDCIGWLTALDPYRRAADAEHYVEGLRKAGFG